MGSRITRKVTAAGRVTLGPEVLRPLGLGPGDVVTVELVPAGGGTPDGDIAAFFGCLPAPSRCVTVEEMAAVIADGWAGREA